MDESGGCRGGRGSVLFQSREPVYMQTHVFRPPQGRPGGLLNLDGVRTEHEQTHFVSYYDILRFWDCHGAFGGDNLNDR